MRPFWVRPSYLTWLIVPALLFAGYQAYGLPHLIWWRTWVDEGRGYDPHQPRTYISCTYIGPYDPITVPATHGACTWIVFFQDTAGRDD